MRLCPRTLIAFWRVGCRTVRVAWSHRGRVTALPRPSQAIVTAVVCHNSTTSHPQQLLVPPPWAFLADMDRFCGRLCLFPSARSSSPKSWHLTTGRKKHWPSALATLLAINPLDELLVSYSIGFVDIVRRVVAEHFIGYFVDACRICSCES